MNRLLILSVVGILSACATTERVELPTWELPTATETAQRPHALPALPELGVAGELATLDKAGLLMLEAFVAVAKGNTTIADENARALELQSKAYNNLIISGQYMAEVASIRQAMLEQSERQATIDKLFCRGTIIGLAAFGFN